jgi:hypothetical protein
MKKKKKKMQFSVFSKPGTFGIPILEISQWPLANTIS